MSGTVPARLRAAASLASAGLQHARVEGGLTAQPVCGRARRTLQPLGVKAADPAPPPTPGGLATYTHRGAARCNTKRRVRFKPCTRRLLETACAGWWRLALLAPLHLMGTAGKRKTGGTRGAPAMSHGETSGVDAVKESVNGVVPDIPAVTAGEVPQVRERRCDPRPFRVGPSCTVWRTVDQDHPNTVVSTLHACVWVTIPPSALVPRCPCKVTQSRGLQSMTVLCVPTGAEGRGDGAGGASDLSGGSGGDRGGKLPACQARRRRGDDRGRLRSG